MTVMKKFCTMKKPVNLNVAMEISGPDVKYYLQILQQIQLQILFET